MKKKALGAQQAAAAQLNHPSNMDKENVAPGHTMRTATLRPILAEKTSPLPTTESDVNEYTSATNYSSSDYEKFLATLQDKTSKPAASPEEANSDENEDIENVVGNAAVPAPTSKPQHFLAAEQIYSLRSLALQRGGKAVRKGKRKKKITALKTDVVENFLSKSTMAPAVQNAKVPMSNVVDSSPTENDAANSAVVQPVEAEEDSVRAASSISAAQEVASVTAVQHQRVATDWINVALACTFAAVAVLFVYSL